MLLQLVTVTTRICVISLSAGNNGGKVVLMNNYGRANVNTPEPLPDVKHVSNEFLRRGEASDGSCPSAVTYRTLWHTYMYVFIWSVHTGNFLLLWGEFLVSFLLCELGTGAIL